MSGTPPAFRSAIAELRQRLPRIPVAPAEAAAARAAARVVAGAGMAGPRAGKDYDRIAREIAAAVVAGEPLDWRRARDGAWCLWTTSPALSQQPAALAAVIEGVSRSGRKTACRTLALSWLTSFEPGHTGTQEVAAALHGLVATIGAPWDRLHTRFGLFDIEAGPRNVAQAAIAERLTPAALLTQTGLSGLAAGGYARHCMSICLEELAAGREPDPMARLALVRALVLKPDGKLQYEGLGPLAVRALLAPFGISMPAKETRDAYLGLLLSLFGDPRMNPGRWTRMRDDEQTVRRWLIEQSLRQFLDVVDRVAVAQMWRYRRAFWEAVYQHDLIADAWVVFDKDGARIARQRLGAGVAFAAFEDRVQQGHAVLLLRVGRGIVSEWSHTGKCIIWSDSGHPSAPRMDAKTYKAASLQAPADAVAAPTAEIFEVTHHNSDLYAWQRKVADRIHFMTGVRIPEANYRVR